MIPWSYALGTFCFGAIAGIVLTIIFNGKYDAVAELVELLTAKDLQAVADWFQAKANSLKAPWK